MKKIFRITLLFLGLVWAQTTVNPNISAIGDLVFTADQSSTSFSNSGVELAFEGYVNPFARASVYIHKHDAEQPAALEEGYLSIERGLPWGLRLRTGRMKPELGRINREHSHQWSYIVPSEAMQAVLGPEYWSANGLEVGALVPMLPWYSNLTAGVFQTGIQIDEDVPVDSLGKATILRWSNFWDFSGFTHGEFGISYYGGGSKMPVIAGLDYKIKWRPDTYRSLSFSGDILHQNDPQNQVTLAGYTTLNYQFNQVYNVGFIADYLNDPAGNTTHSIGGFFGFSPSAESSVFRVLVKKTSGSTIDSSWMLVSQMIWSLGPHKPHQF